MRLDLSGRTALVTDAASGIGRACALRLAAAGARVRAMDRDADGLATLHAAATQTGAEVATGGEAGAGPLAGELEPHPLDLTDLDAADGVDVLVNNAGMQLVRPLHEFPPEDFPTMLTVMLTALFRLIRGTLPHMYAQGWGRVVGAPHGVTSNCVNPGYVRTLLVERQVADQAATHGVPADRVVTDVLLTRPAVKRMVEPAEVAEAVAYLCAPQSAMISGTSLSLDGGWAAS